MRLRALMTLRFFTGSGVKVIQKGETFTPADPQKLIDDGSAEQVIGDDEDDLFSLLGLKRKT